MKLYPGPALATKNIATIKASLHYYVMEKIIVHIMAVDGYVASRKDIIFSIEKAYILPGPHTITGFVRATGGKQTPYMDVKFNAEPGHEYMLNGSLGLFGREQSLWVEDLTTKKIVASAKPQPENGILRAYRPIPPKFSE